LKLTLVGRHLSAFALAAAVGWGASMLVPAGAAELQSRGQAVRTQGPAVRTQRPAVRAQRPAVRTQRPAVRIVRQSAPTACGEWGSITIQACRPLASCSPRTIGSAQVGPLSDAAGEAVDRHLERACTGLSCGPSRTRNDTNSFACQGTSRLCYTRTLEFTCSRVAGRRTAPPRRTPAPPRRTADPAQPPAERATPPAGRPAGRVPVPQRQASPASGDPMAPIGGTGQAGAEPTRTGGPLPTAKASAGPRRVSGPSYPFPGRADELGYGEFWYWKWPDDHGGNQTLGYDLTTARYDAATKQWTECVSDANGKPRCTLCSQAPRNRDCLAYGEPVYAMADGIVERCWRNAPENPRPGQSHAGRLSSPKRIGGGGNALVVRHDNGTYALYAHMQPDTIPAAICPNDGTLMKDADTGTENVVPEDRRARIRTGQFLGRVGNSGASSNPHLHVHVQDGLPGTGAAPLDFTGGMVRAAEGPPDSGWVRLEGQPRLSATTAYWPSFSSGLAEIARHGVPAADYQLLFDHASGSGYRPVWIDGFEVGGRLYFNVLFRPRGGTSWAGFHNLNGDSYQAQYDKMKAQGRRLVFVDSYRVGNTVRYAAVFAADNGPAIAAYHGLTQAQHQERIEKWTKDGWRPKELSVVSLNGRRYYTARYERGSTGSYMARSSVAAADYQALVNENVSASRRTVYLEAYEHNGQQFFSVIFESLPGSGYNARHGLTGAGYQEAWAAARKSGLRTQVVVGYPAGNDARYAAIWTK